MLKDADRLVRFVGTGRDLTDVEYEAAIRMPFLSCDNDDNEIDSVLTVNLVALRGPADDDRLARIAYFVAIVDQENRVLTRQELTSRFPSRAIGPRSSRRKRWSNTSRCGRKKAGPTTGFSWDSG
jgi:hypothetical protein